MPTMRKTFLFGVGYLFCKLPVLAWTVCHHWNRYAQFLLFLLHRHRHQDDHKCEKLEVQKPRMAATKELVQKILGQLKQFLSDGSFSVIPLIDHMESVVNKMFTSAAAYLHLYVMFVFLCSESKDESKRKGRRGAKNSATAAKVALMKLKLHATGDKGLPQVSSYLLLF